MSVLDPAHRTPSVRAPRPAEERPTLALVPRRSARRSTRLWLTVFATTLFLVLFGAVSFHVTLVQNQRQIDRLGVEADQAQTRYDKIRVEVDRLESPSRIVRDAGKLGLVQPGDATWLAPIVPEDRAAIDDAEVSESTAPDTTAGSYSTVKPYLGGSR